MEYYNVQTPIHTIVNMNASMQGCPYFIGMDPISHAQDATWNAFVARYAVEGRWLEWTIVTGAVHLSCSYMPLWVEMLPKIPDGTDLIDLGDVTGKRAGEYLKTYVGAFGEWFRGGRYDREELDGPKEESPEAVLNRTIRSYGFVAGR